MDLQIYKLNNLEERDLLPTIKYTIQVIKKKKNIDFTIYSKKYSNFMKSICDGDLILLEYPPIYYSKGTGGVQSFMITLVNLSNNTKVTTYASNIESRFWDNLDEIKVIE